MVDLAQLQARGVELRLDLGHGVPKLERHREGMVLTGEGPHGLHVQSQGAIDVQAHDGVSLKSAGTVKVSARELDLDADEALRAHGRALSVLSDEATSIAANHLTLSGGAELTANAPVIDLAASVGLHAHGPAVELLAESNGVVRIGGERLLANVEKVGIYATNSLEITSSVGISIGATNSLQITSSADVSIEAASAVKLSGQKVRADAGGIELEAGVVSTHGKIKAETVECNAVIATSYTPGAGNIW